MDRVIRPIYRVVVADRRHVAYPAVHVEFVYGVEARLAAITRLVLAFPDHPILALEVNRIA